MKQIIFPSVIWLDAFRYFRYFSIQARPQIVWLLWQLEKVKVSTDLSSNFACSKVTNALVGVLFRLVFLHSKTATIAWKHSLKQTLKASASFRGCCCFVTRKYNNVVCKLIQISQCNFGFFHLRINSIFVINENSTQNIVNVTFDSQTCICSHRLPRNYHERHRKLLILFKMYLQLSSHTCTLLR